MSVAHPVRDGGSGCYPCFLALPLSFFLVPGCSRRPAVGSFARRVPRTEHLTATSNILLSPDAVPVGPGSNSSILPLPCRIGPFPLLFARRPGRPLRPSAAGNRPRKDSGSGQLIARPTRLSSLDSASTVWTTE